MRLLLTIIISIFTCVAHAQLSIDNRRVLYDSINHLMLATIPQEDFGKHMSYAIHIDEGWNDLKINGINVKDTYPFKNISANKSYTISIKTADGNLITSKLMFTFLPMILLEGNFSNDYSDGKMSIISPNETPIDTLSGFIKWRGGSTNTPDKHKRNYKIKLDNDIQLFGLRTDNKWILDAGQFDLFRIRNRIATELWNDMSSKPYYADSEPEALSGVRGQMVEMFLGHEYRGIYCLTECMDRKEMKLKKVKNTGDIRGCLYKSDGYGASIMWSYPATYDNSSERWDTFEVKYPELDDAPETDWSTLWNAINFVATSSDDEFCEHVEEYFDMPVVIDYYIFINVMNASDNNGKNMFWAVYDKTIDKKLTIGVWDLDLTAGSKTLEYYLSGIIQPHSPEYEIIISLNLYHRLKKLNANSFNDKVIERYHQLRNTYLATDSVINRYTNYYNLINLSGAAIREEEKWSGDSDILGEIINFEEEIHYMNNWLASHLEYLDNNLFKLDSSASISSNITDGQTDMFYNLNGQKIEKPSKGIYIRNRKKVIVR